MLGDSNAELAVLKRRFVIGFAKDGVRQLVSKTAVDKSYVLSI